MFYNDPTTRESADYINPESAPTSEETSEVMGKLAARIFTLDDILNSLPEVSSSNTSSEE